MLGWTHPQDVIHAQHFSFQKEKRVEHKQEILYNESTATNRKESAYAL